jgi:tripartite-type tricarboxylate transporter receptor subunit TctC
MLDRAQRCAFATGKIMGGDDMTSPAVKFAIAALFCALEVLPTAAQDWPSRPIRIMVGFGPGGGTDVATRVIADPLGKALGTSIVVENKPGAGGTIAGDIVAKGAKDGTNALMISAGHTVSAVMIKSQPYDAVKDFAPVGIVGNSAFVVLVQKDSPARDLQGLIAMAKKEPGKLNYGTVGIGSTQHLTAELLRQRSGIEAQAVSFRTTGELVTALLRKDVAYAVDLAHAVRGQVESGDLRILAVATPKRWPSIPNVPTIAESGLPGFDVLGWYGLVYPAGVAPSIVEKTSKALNQVLGSEAVRKQLENIGALAVQSTPQEFGKMIEGEIARWREVTKAAGIEPK